MGSGPQRHAAVESEAPRRNSTGYLTRRACFSRLHAARTRRAGLGLLVADARVGLAVNGGVRVKQRLEIDRGLAQKLEIVVVVGARNGDVVLGVVLPGIGVEKEEDFLAFGILGQGGEL